MQEVARVPCVHSHLSLSLSIYFSIFLGGVVVNGIRAWQMNCVRQWSFYSVLYIACVCFQCIHTTDRQLLCARALMGVAIGSAAPIKASLLPDIFPIDRRYVAMALAMFSGALGLMIGQVMGGSVGNGEWAWQRPYRLTSGALVICGALILGTTTDPPRVSGAH